MKGGFQSSAMNIQAEEMLEEDKVAAAAHGQEFRQPLNGAEQNDL